jgi:hypothetical protein
VFTAGDGSNGLAFIVDARSKTCREINGCLDLWGIGNRYLGKREWKNTLRIALRDYGTLPWSMAQVREHKEEVEGVLRSAGVKAVAMLQSPLIPGVKTSHSAWNMFGRGGSPYKYGGTVWQEDGLWRCPLLNPQSYEYAYGWLFQRWFVQALAVAKGQVRPLPWPRIVTMPGPDMLDALVEIGADQGPLSIDIETNMGGSIITAIGLSSATLAVSVGWDGYMIAGRSEWEAGIEQHPMGQVIRDLVAGLIESDIPKVGQNIIFDQNILRKRGINIGGEVHDTLLMGRVAFPQFRRGLQQLAAIEFCVNPWKSFHKPAKPPRGLVEFDPWLSTPPETRHYNGQDCLVTRLLYHALGKRIGMVT